MSNFGKPALIVEDDPDVAALIKVPLEELGYLVDIAADGPNGLKMALGKGYQLVVLDLRLPGLNGDEVCKGIRKEKTMPIIMLTSVKDDINKVLLLELGADDYLTKPFNVFELKARINAVMRRVDGTLGQPLSEQATEEVLTFDELTIDLGRRQVLLSDEKLHLSAGEFSVLALLASRPGFPFTREKIIEVLYGEQYSSYDQSVSSYINRIRAKIEPNPSKPKFIITRRGVGYSFTEKSEE